MNKYQEALDRIKNQRVKVNIWEYMTFVDENSDLDTLQELVDRATPMKARADSVGCYCGNCAYRLGDNNGWTQAIVKYCGNCGQRID